MRQVRLSAALVGAALLAAACAGSPPAASGEIGEVTVLCGATEEYCAAQTEGFTSSTGIPARFVRLSSGEATARLEAGKASPEFDAWIGGPADGYQAAADGGLLEPYTSPNAAAIRPEWKAADGSWTGVYVGVLGLCNNTRVLQERGLPVPTSWQDLLDPRFAQNIAVAHAGTSGTGYTVVWTQVALAGGDQNAGLAYMQNLRPNVLNFTKSGSGPVQMVGRGEIATGIVFSHDCVASQEEGFTDLEVTFPSEGVGYEVGAVAVIQGAPNSEGGRAFVDWALTAESQEIPATVGSFQVPTNPDAAVPEQAAHLDQVNLVEYDIAAAAAAKSELVGMFDAAVAAPPAS